MEIICENCNLLRSKICNECYNEKCINQFYKGRKKCKECIMRKNNIQIKITKQRILFDVQYCKCALETKICKKCNNLKNIDSFDNGRKTCKECRKEYNKDKYMITKKLHELNEVISKLKAYTNTNMKEIHTVRMRQV